MAVIQLRKVVVVVVDTVVVEKNLVSCGSNSETKIDQKSSVSRYASFQFSGFTFQTLKRQFMFQVSGCEKIVQAASVQPWFRPNLGLNGALNKIGSINYI